MENKGIIRKIVDNDLYVQLFRDSACAHCSGCDTENKIIENLFHYKLKEEDSQFNPEVGNLITFGVNNKFILNLALLIYILPVFLMIFSFILADKFGASEGMGIIVSFSTLVISFVAFFFYDRKKGATKVNKEIFIMDIKK